MGVDDGCWGRGGLDRCLCWRMGGVSDVGEGSQQRVGFTDGAAADTTSTQGPWPQPRTGLRCHGESYVQWTDGGDAFGRCILAWKRQSIGPLPFVRRALPGCKTLTSWSGDGGANGVMFLLGCVVLEARACLSVTAASIVARKVEA